MGLQTSSLSTSFIGRCVVLILSEIRTTASYRLKVGHHGRYQGITSASSHSNRTLNPVRPVLRSQNAGSVSDAIS